MILCINLGSRHCKDNPLLLWCYGGIIPEIRHYRAGGNPVELRIPDFARHDGIGC